MTKRSLTRFEFPFKRQGLDSLEATEANCSTQPVQHMITFFCPKSCAWLLIAETVARSKLCS